MFDWSRLDTVLLDMDGTLLDLHFDNHFWLEHVPRRYAETRGIELAAAREALLPRYRDIEGTLNWYCVDHWSRELGLDIALLKQEVDHLIQIHPHVPEFLAALRSAGKERVLVTNAHQKAIALKMEKTRLAGHFDRIVCSHDIGRPKEDPGFWPCLHSIMPFDPERTLFVDDSVRVLRAARAYGIAGLLAITAPDSRQSAREVDEFDAIRDFSELLPGLERTLEAT
ncbi:MAG: GMP/IMP nucleotidase [Gammaproteobacteria bacterium]|jgi:5'-nucleotidase